jgi:hypothetical protein
MADVSDVEAVLTSVLTQQIYPSGTSEPSIVNTPCKIYRGWPIPANLDSDLAAGIINVSVFPQALETNVTKYQRKWLELPVAEPTLTVEVFANTITILGVPSSPLNVAAIVNGTAYVYAVQPSDTLTSIATGLAALINVDIEATSSQNVVTVEGGNLVPVPAMHLAESGPLSRRFGGALLGSMAGYWPFKAMNMAISGVFGKRFGGAILPSMAAYWPTPSVGITARVGVVGSVIRELKRQKRGFQITFWCPSPALRDEIVAPCDAFLAGTDYLSLPDGTLGRLRYERTAVSDKVENERLYRRDLFYSVEYGTTQTMSAPKVVSQKFVLSGGCDQDAENIKTFFN